MIFLLGIVAMDLPVDVEINLLLGRHLAPNSTSECHLTFQLSGGA
jgi:hypothetical protein